MTYVPSGSFASFSKLGPLHILFFSFHSIIQNKVFFTESIFAFSLMIKKNLGPKSQKKKLTYLKRKQGNYKIIMNITEIFCAIMKSSMPGRHRLKLNLPLDKTTNWPNGLNKIRAAPIRSEPIQDKALFQDFQELIGVFRAPGVSQGVSDHLQAVSCFQLNKSRLYEHQFDHLFYNQFTQRTILDFSFFFQFFYH